MATLLWTDVEVGAIEGRINDVKEFTGDDCVQTKVLCKCVCVGGGGGSDNSSRTPSYSLMSFHSISHLVPLPHPQL